MSANAVFQPPHMRWMYWPFRGQTERRPVRSHEIQFLQRVTGCLNKRRLAGDAVDAVYQENRVIVHR
ncbi:hypothetical protein, partial [Pseudomonas viridiflava]|uniref:hypothetical protein n=1 Tax=Pseudomonas viridiflava TaxID=33069 RepID=UPI0019803F15